jgi:hypothetical protein
VGLYTDSPEIESITGDIKKGIFVGLCGSFSEDNKSILMGLKKYLNKNGYKHVFTADDFPTNGPRIICGDAKYEDAYNVSMSLVIHCDICIIFFFVSDKNPEVNQSAVAEIQELCSKGKKNVIVLLENGFSLRSNLKGIKYKSGRNKWWDWNDFFRDEIQDCFIHVKQTCHNIVLERFVKLEK